MSMPPSPNAKQAPEAMALRARPRPVVRLSRRALFLLGGVSAGILGAATIWALRFNHTGRPPPQELYSTERKQIAEGLNGLPRDYSGLPKPEPVPQLGPPLPGDLGRPILRAQQEGMNVPVSTGPSAEEQARIAERQRLAQEREQAMRAQVFFQIKQRASSTTGPVETPAPVTTNPFAPAPSATEGNRPDEAMTQNGQDRKSSFLNASVDTKIYSPQKLQTPVSPYQLMAGTLLSAAMVTGLNSDLPGQAIATIIEPVYDTVTGRTLLIPQGSKLMGQYDSQVSYGQSRILLVWNRVVMPDGSSIVLDRLSGADTKGFSGLEDEVDNHWGKLIAGAALSTLLGIGAELGSQNSGLGGTGQQTVVVASSRSAENSVNQVGQQITRRNLNVQPTITVRPGFPVRVIVNKDIVLRPYGVRTARRGASE